MKTKRLIEKIEDTLSCFFNTQIKYKEISNGFRELYFNKKPTGITITLDDLMLLNISSTEEQYNDFIVDNLKKLKEFK